MSLQISLDVPAEKLQENVSCHLIPCKISHNGSCNVKKYFDPYIRNAENILSCSLRGHPLQGQVIEVPDGYKGIILKENKKLSMSDDKRDLKAVGSFKEFTFWNWDKTPSKDDKIMKFMQWKDVASALHKPVSEYEGFEIDDFKTGVKRKQSETDP